MMPVCDEVKRFEFRARSHCSLFLSSVRVGPSEERMVCDDVVAEEVASGGRILTPGWH